jgi:hypothetical protein
MFLLVDNSHIVAKRIRESPHTCIDLHLRTPSSRQHRHKVARAKRLQTNAYAHALTYSYCAQSRNSSSSLTLQHEHEETQPDHHIHTYIHTYIHTIQSRTYVKPQQPLRVWATGMTTHVRTYRDICYNGSFSPNGLQPCTNCSAGTFTARTSSTFCAPCSVGAYSNMGATHCLLCPAGTFGNRTGLSMCFNCPAVAPRSKPGSISASNCTDFCRAGSFGRLQVCYLVLVACW